MSLRVPLNVPKKTETVTTVKETLSNQVVVNQATQQILCTAHGKRESMISACSKPAA